MLVRPLGVPTPWHSVRCLTRVQWTGASWKFYVRSWTHQAATTW